MEEHVLRDLSWLSVEADRPKHAFDIEALKATVEAKTKTMNGIANAMQTHGADPVMMTVIMGQLKTASDELTKAKSELSAAQQATATAKAPALTLSDLTDRNSLHAALKQRLKGVWFRRDNVVELEGHGLSMFVQARVKNSYGAMLMTVGQRKEGDTITVNGKTTSLDDMVKSRTPLTALA